MKSRNGLHDTSVGTFAMYFSAPRWVTSRWRSSSIADILRLLAVNRLTATGTAPKTDTVAFAAASLGGRHVRALVRQCTTRRRQE